MEHQFDPINLTVFPNPGVLFKRSNAFVAGILVNRIIFEIALAGFAGRIQPASVLKTNIDNLESWHDWIEKVANPESDFSDWLLKEIDQLEKQAADSGTKGFPEGDFFICRPCPDFDRMRFSRFIAEAIEQCNCLVSVFGKEGQFFSLGLILDGLTNGYSGGEVRKLSCEKINKKSKWRVNGLASNPKANPQLLTSLSRSFIRRLKTVIGDQLFPFDVLKKGVELPPPLDWAEAIISVWSTLARDDQDEAGFRRVELNSGEIYLDGRLLGVIPRDNHPYIALKYIVSELQKDPTQWFTSEKVYREIYKLKPLNVAKRREASKTSLGKPVTHKTNTMRGETQTPEYGKLHDKIEGAIGNIFEKIDALNTRKGFTLRITQFSKAVLA